jgi:co-chaperonin GroES (HSP10)
MAFQCAFNNVVVTVKTRWIKNFSQIAKIAHIQNNSSIMPQDMVNIVGEVVSVPKTISKRREYTGFSTRDIRAGDTVIFSHNVIFNFESTAAEEEPIHKNSVWCRGKEYWLADIREIYAVIRDGQIRMQNGYVMLEQMDAAPMILLPTHIKKRIKTVCANVSHIGKNLSHLQKINVEKGDVIYLNPAKAREYQVNGNPFFIVTQQQILGTQIPTYAQQAALN